MRTPAVLLEIYIGFFGFRVEVTQLGGFCHLTWRRQLLDSQCEPESIDSCRTQPVYSAEYRATGARSKDMGSPG